MTTAAWIRGPEPRDAGWAFHRGLDKGKKSWLRDPFRKTQVFRLKYALTIIQLDGFVSSGSGFVLTGLFAEPEVDIMKQSLSVWFLVGLGCSNVACQYAPPPCLCDVGDGYQHMLSCLLSR